MTYASYKSFNIAKYPSLLGNTKLSHDVTEYMGHIHSIASIFRCTAGLLKFRRWDVMCHMLIRHPNSVIVPASWYIMKEFSVEN